MRRVMLFGFGLWFMAGPVAQVARAVPEVEPNDSFAERQVIASGDTTLEGDLENVFSTFDESRAGVLAEGVVDSWTFTGAAPSAPFIAWIDNAFVGPGPGFDPDTLLGEFDTLGILVNLDDDASPVGDGYASALTGTVNSDGTFRLKVTGWPDFDFDGQDDGFPEDPHFESGAYSLFVRIGEVPDVDYVTFTGLTPGATFDAEIVDAEFDTGMGRFDDSGALIDFDGGFLSPLPRLMGDVPPNGQLHLAISSSDDSNLNGLIENDDEFGPYGVGTYDLVVQVPEPGSAWLLGAALAAVVGLVRRRGCNDILRGPSCQESP